MPRSGTNRLDDTGPFRSGRLNPQRATRHGVDTKTGDAAPTPMTTDSNPRDDTLVLIVAILVMLATLAALVARSAWGA